MLACHSCASGNPDSQKFCGECGARLTVPASGHTLSSPAGSYTPPHLAEKIPASRFALEGERKLVTVMFCDIANSTPLAASLGAEAMHALLNSFFEIALGEVHRYEGTPSASPSSFIVAGAGFAECYTQPDALWIDLIP